MADFTKIADRMYEGASTDTKPTGVPNGTICRYTDTREAVITYDGGTTYVNADKRIRIVGESGAFIDLTTDLATLNTSIQSLLTTMGLVAGSPVENTMQERLKAVETAVAALGYEFTINGVNFNGYANIKMLTLDGNAEDDDPITLHDAGVDYQVGVGKVFIAYGALIWLEQIAMVGRIGESDTADGAITKEVIKASNGTQVPFMEPVVGVYAAGKYVTAESDSASDNYTIKSGSVLYGVEVDA